MTVLDATQVDWDAARDMFALDPSVTHLNHGSFGAVPAPVRLAQQRWRDEIEADPMRFYHENIGNCLAAARADVAAFLGADTASTALVGNATAGVAVALNTVERELRPGDEILTTTHGYGAVDLAIARVCARTGAQHVAVQIPVEPAGTSSEAEIIALIGAAIHPGRTRVAIIDQVTSPTAQALPVAALTAALHEAGVIVIVDAAHAPGMLPVRVADLDADFWTGNLHKWAFAPRGTAALIVSPRWHARVQPLIVSWSQPDGFPSAVEFAGTLDYTPWLAAPEGIRLMAGLGIDRIRTHNSELAAYGQRRVGEAIGWAVSDLPGAVDPLVSMRLVPVPADAPGLAAGPEALRARIFAELATRVPVTSWAGHSYIRLSAQIYNSPLQYDRFAEAIGPLLQTPG